ncbi:class II myosin [Massospora cicadina]|nr:class II myosin [Massospora cicadina]
MSRPSPSTDEAKLDPDKRWVWVEDIEEGYVAGYIVEDKGDQFNVNLTNGQLCWVNVNDTQKVNPSKFERVQDMAELSYLNEASVAHNLKMRYLSNLIYTYSGLFLVVVNPYRKLPIYTEKMVRSYKNKRRSEMPPHIYSVADGAFHFMLQNRENQSILITGESGAGKTENTKKVIQYLTSVASDRAHGRPTDTLEQQILRANPILEAFGNAQTIRNNNSSRFGKFIRIEFSSGGQIAGANIEKYLFEKSRVTHQSQKERNYHIFYQFVKGAPKETLDQFLISDDLNSYAYTKNSMKSIDGVDDVTDFKITREAMEVMRFTREQQHLLFRVLAAVLHLGNLRPTSDRDDQAQLRDTSAAEKLCHVLGIPVAEFTKGLLRPQMKAGRDWVTQARTVGQVLYSLESLARALYERMFGMLVEWINAAMERPSEKSTFIGVLDIAGFEIFEVNSFEQLCINYNNEKLQQFFNHHMFKREQEEYLREGIDWKFIDFGLDLQPTIDLIEKSNPIGILSCLDEECVMPKATDKTFVEKLTALWKDNSDKFGALKFHNGFMLKHYASNVEYRTEGWLDKNSDPLNENITRLLAHSSERYIAALFADYLHAPSFTGLSRTKRGVFRTVGQRHKEQLTLLMSQLHATEPHFVRCILPNQEKRPGKINTKLVLDQLRCNGVLEGIRICRAGFPNRLPFSEFRQRYEILAPCAIPRGFMDGKRAAQRILEAVQLDPGRYRIGGSKVFFRAGVLAELEEARDANLAQYISQFQANGRGYLARKLYRKRIDQVKAIRTIQKNARIYVQLREWSWWRLYTKVKPLLNVTRVDEELKRKEDAIRSLEAEIGFERQRHAELDRAKGDLDSEKRKLEELLMSERNAALDNEEILRRTQQREVALEEELREMAAEFEQLEAQLEEAAQAKDEAFAKCEGMSLQLEEELLRVSKLEKEKFGREDQIKQLRAELSSEHERAAQLDSDRKALDANISELQKALAIGKDAEAELVKVRSRLEAQVAELTAKFQAEAMEREKLDERRLGAETNLRETSERAAGFERRAAELQAQLDKQLVEFSNLGKQLKVEEGAKATIDKQRRDLSLRIEALEGELSVERAEKQQAHQQRKKLEEEVAGLHKLIEEKGDAESKQNEHRRLRETELVELRASLERCQDELQEVRRSNMQLVDSLRSELEQNKVDNEGLTKSRDLLDSQVKELAAQLESIEVKASDLEKAKRHAEKSLDAMLDRTSDLEASLAEVRANREELERLLVEANASNEELSAHSSRVQRETQALERQLERLKEELAQETAKRAASEGHKKKLGLELSDLQARLEEAEANKDELRRKFDAKTTELQTLRESLSAEASERVSLVEEAKRKAELRLAELQPAYEEVTRQCAALEKSKGRLVSDLEDLHHELEREHTGARNAEKMVKQMEAQMASAAAQLESERHEREAAEANHRKLQSAYDMLEKQMAERHEQFATLAKSKGDMEAELRALIDEIGDGGRNFHELEKAKRRLEADLEAKSYALEALDTRLAAAEDQRRQVEEQLADLQNTFKTQLLAKDAQLEETRRLLLKEVNQLGERLDEEMAAKHEALKVRKRLEDQIDDLISNVDHSTQSKSDLEDAKRKAEEYIKTLQATLESEERLRLNFEELAHRHELKSNQLQTRQENLELQLEAMDKIKRQLEQRVHDLTAELEEGESKAALNETIRRLMADKARLEEDLLDARADLESTRAPPTGGLATAEAQKEMSAQLEKLEESRRALQVAQRMAQQELATKQHELETALQAREAIQAETEKLRSALEDEIEAKNAESASQRRYKRAFNELSIKFEAEQARSAELKEASDTYKSKINDLANHLEIAEVAKAKALRQLSSMKERNRELEEAKVEAELRLEQAELEIRELQERVEEHLYNELRSNNENSDLPGGNARLAEELHRIREEAEQDFRERAAELEAIRSKYQLRLNELTEALEASQSELLSQQTHCAAASLQASDLTSQLENQAELLELSKRENEKLAARLEALTAELTEATTKSDTLSRELEMATLQLRQVSGQLEVKESECSSLAKSKRLLQDQLKEVENRFTDADQTRLATERSLSEIDQEAAELKELLDQHQDRAGKLHLRLAKAEQALAEAQAELARTRQLNSELLRARGALEKHAKELEFEVIDLKSVHQLSGHLPTNGITRLTARIEELAAQLDSETNDKHAMLRNTRKADRMVRELQFQLAERDKQRVALEAHSTKATQTIQQLRDQIDELENSESALQLSKRRAEREAADERERAARLEREVERLKARLDKNLSATTSPYGSLKSPSLPPSSFQSNPSLGTLSSRKSVQSNASLGALSSRKSIQSNASLGTLSSRKRATASSRGPSIANSNFRELLYAFQSREEPKPSDT